MDFAVIVGAASRSILLYVRTRGADETGERREKRPTGVDNFGVNLYICTSQVRLPVFFVEFLTSITPEEALGLIVSFPVGPLREEEVSLEQAAARVLAADITAQVDIPPFPRSLVDGYAVRVKDTYGAREGTPAFLRASGEVPVGEAAEARVGDGEAVYVATGAMIPDGADGAVMVEYTRRTDGAVEVTRTVRRGENICFRGEDVREGQVVLEKGRVVSPFDTGVLAALGLTRVPVFSQPVVGLISSGNEIVPADGVMEAGKVRDINSHTVSGLVKRQGCLVRFAGIARDTVDDIASMLSALQGVRCDTAFGRELEGPERLHDGGHRAARRKGPLSRPQYKAGQADDLRRPVGKAGIRTSRPSGLLRHGRAEVRAAPPGAPERREAQPVRSGPCAGRLTTNIPSSYGIEEYVRVSVERREGQAPLVTPIFAKSSVISTLSKADGYVVVPEGQEGVEAGVEVEVLPLG